jgi:hypothetical protein
MRDAMFRTLRNCNDGGGALLRWAAPCQQAIAIAPSSPTDEGGPAMVTLLHEQSETRSETARVKGEDLWISPRDFERATGWTLKPEGFCLGDVCVPVPSNNRLSYVDGDKVNAAAFWRRLGNPIVRDASGEVWALGTAASGRAASLHSLEAPDFALPDLSGVTHRLSEQRGKKVLLATWASW